MPQHRDSHGRFASGTGITLRAASGRDPDEVFVDLERALTPTVSDMALAGELVKTDIRDKTASGVDVDGAPFAPYSTSHPYYYNPATAGGKFAAGSLGATQGAAKRLKKKLGDAGRGGELSSTRRTIRFDSYADFKSSFGRGNVDLFGVFPPHMLDAMVVQVDGGVVSPGSADQTPASVATVGIYDADAAARASGHNEGTSTLPKRRFFGISTEAARRVRDVIFARLIARAKSGGASV